MVPLYNIFSMISKTNVFSSKDVNMQVSTSKTSSSEPSSISTVDNSKLSIMQISTLEANSKHKEESKQYFIV